MNRRQWKKACKKAAAEVERRRPGQYQFVPATGAEAVDAPPGYKSPYHGRRSRTDRRYPAVPRGTPIVWICSGYYEPEWDCYTALEILLQIEHEDWWESLSEEEMASLFEPSFDAALEETVEALWYVLQQPDALQQNPAVPAIGQPVAAG